MTENDCASPCLQPLKQSVKPPPHLRADSARRLLAIRYYFPQLSAVVPR